MSRVLCSSWPCTILRSSEHWADGIGLLELKQKCSGRSRGCISKLVVIAKQKRHVHFGSIQNKTQRVCQVGKKEKICRKLTNKALALVWCLSWTQVSISKCIFQARRCFHRAVVFCSIFAQAGHHTTGLLRSSHLQLGSWCAGCSCEPCCLAGMLSTGFCPSFECAFWWVVKSHSEVLPYLFSILDPVSILPVMKNCLYLGKNNEQHECISSSSSSWTLCFWIMSP